MTDDISTLQQRTATLLSEVAGAAKRAPQVPRGPLQPPQARVGRLGLLGFTFQRTPSFTELFPSLPSKPRKRGSAEIPAVSLTHRPAKMQRSEAQLEESFKRVKTVPAVHAFSSDRSSSPVSSEGVGSENLTEILSQPSSPPADRASNELFDPELLRLSPTPQSNLGDGISLLDTPDLKSFARLEDTEFEDLCSRVGWVPPIPACTMPSLQLEQPMPMRA